METHIRHLKEKKEHRGIKRVGVVGAALLVIPAVAIALIVHTVYLSGSWDTGSASVKYSTGAPPAVIAGDCTGAYVDDQNMSISWPGNPFPGETCSLGPVFAYDGAAIDMKLQGVTGPPGLDVSVAANCGLEIVVDQTATPGARLDLTIAADHPVGTPIVITPSQFGFEWIDSASYVAGNCA